MRIACFQLADESGRLFFYEIEATTDRNGRYRLVGLPRGRGNQVLVLPAKRQPYLRRALEITETPGLEPRQPRHRPKRGVPIEGRVTDKETGELLQADVMYNAFEDNPHLAEAPGYDEIVPDYVCARGRDQTARTTSWPSRPWRHLGDLPRQGGWLSHAERGLRFPLVPHASLGGSNMIAEVNLPETAITYRHDLALDEITRLVRVVDSEGKMVSDAWLWPTVVRNKIHQGMASTWCRGSDPRRQCAWMPCARAESSLVQSRSTRTRTITASLKNSSPWQALLAGC